VEPIPAWKRTALLSGVLLLTFLWLLPLGADEMTVARGDPPRATWVWDASLISQPENCTKLFRFCRTHHITLIYLSAYNVRAPLEKSYREFNQQAHRAGLRVHALAGDPRWGLTRYHAVPLQWVEDVRRLNAAAAPEERFDGVHTDVEVYLLSKGWNERPAELLGGYLDLNAKIKDLLQTDPSPIRFGADIPFWFDDDPNYRILWHGQVKPASYHVIDSTDEVTVLAYRNFAEGPDGTIHLVSLEMDYADTVGKKVMIGQETQEDLFPAYVTFGGSSCARLNQELKKIEKALGNRPSFGGFAIHHYESYKKLCGD